MKFITKEQLSSVITYFKENIVDKADSLINISSTDTAVVVNCENNRRYKFGVITSLDLSKAPLFDDNSICELRFETNGTLPTITLGDDLIGLSEYDIAVNSYVTMIVSGSIITCGSVAKEV